MNCVLLLCFLAACCGVGATPQGVEMETAVLVDDLPIFSTPVHQPPTKQLPVQRAFVQEWVLTSRWGIAPGKTIPGKGTLPPSRVGLLITVKFHSPFLYHNATLSQLSGRDILSLTGMDDESLFV